jgi:NADP-dependent 3-hydroxy acid dehydrogenase YdfG
VNNAGILGNVAWDDWLNISDYEQTLQVNTLGVIRVTHAFLQLIKVECGRVVLMSSVCGKSVFNRKNLKSSIAQSKIYPQVGTPRHRALHGFKIRLGK